MISAQQLATLRGLQVDYSVTNPAATDWATDAMDRACQYVEKIEGDGLTAIPMTVPVPTLAAARFIDTGCAFGSIVVAADDDTISSPLQVMLYLTEAGPHRWMISTFGSVMPIATPPTVLLRGP